MSRVEKMSMQGIRSFGPDDNDRGVVEFFTPLTLILGPNGTGKTTIIECLKFAASGDQPPNSTKNAAFIHDPKIAHESEVRGQVRLQFRDVRDVRNIIVRSMQATQKPTKVERKILECTIVRKGPDGEKICISSKCSDIDKEMTTLLGVSKAVLDSVIFCHQEDSNWPLSEGKALKERFDDIFASTRYVKALAAIKKLRSEKHTETRVLQGEIGYLKQNKEKASTIRAQLEQKQAELEASKETIRHVSNQLAPILKSLEKIEHQESEVITLNTEIEKLKSKKVQMDQSQDELRNNITNVFQGSTEDLQQRLDDFGAQLQERQQELDQLQRKLQRAEADLNELGQRKMDQLLNQDRLEQDAKNYRDNIKKREDKIHQIALELGIQGFDGALDDEILQEFQDRLKSSVDNCLRKAKAKKADYEEQEDAIDKQIMQKRAQKTKIETEHNLKKTEQRQNNEEIKKITSNLQRLDRSAGKLDGLCADIRKEHKKLSEVEGSVNPENLKADIAGQQRKKTELETTLRQLDAELNRMTEESTTRAQLDSNRTEKKEKATRVHKMRARHEETLRHLLSDYSPDDNLLRRKVEDYLRKTSRDNQKKKDDLEKLKMKLSSQESQRRYLVEQKDNKERELRESEDKIYRECESQDFDEGLEKIKRQLLKNQETRGLLQGTETLFTKYIEQLRRSDPPCPLCHRPFDDQSEVTELAQELEDKLRLVPEKLERVQRDITEGNEKHNRMQQLKPSKSRIEQLRETDIPDVTGRLNRVLSDITKIKEDITEVEDILETSVSDESMARNLLPDLAQIDTLYGEIKDLTRKIEMNEAQLGGAQSGKTIQEVNVEREELQRNIEELNREIERKRNRLTSHIEQVQQLKTSVNQLEAEKLRLERDIQDQQKLEQERVKLIEKNKTLHQEIQDAADRAEPLEAEISLLVDEKETIVEQKEKRAEEDRTKYSSMKDHQRKVEEINLAINKYVDNNGDEKLQKVKKTIEQLENKATQLDTLKEEQTKKINSIQKELSTQKVQEREFQDNLQLRQREVEIQKVKDDIKKRRDELGDLDTNNLGQEKRRLSQQYNRLDREKNNAVAQQTSLQDQVRLFTNDLAGDYKDADIKFQDKYIKLRTMELAVSDLDKYHKALDRTIMTYHKQKMEEINKIIRELWRTTYKGNDIETIEIRSNSDDREKTASTRAVYNYRVVMIKGDTAIDMRGRCSAGQKVLASLIIRMALAETFCLNCGILALDEPTTNLDRENIESLAYALVQIIKNRHAQLNFQLIVITHDEDFVELLGRSDYVEEFYKVSKDEFGHSMVKRARVEDLHR